MESPLKKILVVGDMIDDEYVFGTASRMCPEAPVPVLVPDYVATNCRQGAAGLVHKQLEALSCGDSASVLRIGSLSKKTRYFANGHLLLRVDEDRQHEEVFLSERENFRNRIIQDLSHYVYDGVVISDYDKGTFDTEFADQLVWQCAKRQIPSFVDSKKNWSWYAGATFFFPNENETPGLLSRNGKTTIIQKLGARGASINGKIIAPNRAHAVRDVTGAGDCFLAAFVNVYLKDPRPHHQDIVEIGVRFANRVAGLSVEHIGTHVVTKEELDKSYE